MTPLWHISSHYLEVEVFMSLFKNEQSHLTETNCCCSCLVMSQWLVSLQIRHRETCLATHQMYFRFILTDIVGPVHVATVKGPLIFDCVFIYRTSFLCHNFYHCWVTRAGGGFFSQSALEHIDVNAAEVTHFTKFNALRAVTVSIWSAFLS